MPRAAPVTTATRLMRVPPSRLRHRRATPTVGPARRHAGDGGGQVGAGGAEQGPALLGRRRRRVAEDAVGADRPDPARREEGEELVERRDGRRRRRRRGAPARGRWPASATSRCARRAGRRPTAGHQPDTGGPRRPGGPSGPGQRRGVAAVGAGQHHVVEGRGGRAAQLDQQRLGGLRPDGEGAGETRRARRWSRRRRRGRPPAAGRVPAAAVGDGHGDVGVGGERQVGAVLLGGADRAPRRTAPAAARAATSGQAARPGGSRDARVRGRSGGRVQVAVTGQEGEQHVGRLGGVGRARPPWADRGPPVRRSGPAGEPGVVALGGRQRPGRGARTGGSARRGRAGRRSAGGGRRGDRSTGTGIASAARAPASDARRSRTPAASTEHTAGRGTRRRSRHPPSSRRSADQAPVGRRRPGHQAEGLGGTQLVGQEGGQGAGAPVDRAVAAHHQVGGPERGDGGGQRAGQVALVVGQLGHVAVAVALVARRDPHDGDTESGHLAEHRVDRARARRTRPPPGPPTPRRSGGRARGRRRRPGTARRPAGPGGPCRRAGRRRGAGR